MDRAHWRFVDQALREVARRLFGRRGGLHTPVPEPIDQSAPDQVSAWAQTARYLNGRIHVAGEPPSHRTEDLSVEAAAAMKAVLQEVGSGVTPRLRSTQHAVVARDPQLDKLAKMMGVHPAASAPWLHMFLDVTEQLPHAVMLCDMTVPGIKVLSTNSAGERLTGYPRCEHSFPNCRFMQGPNSEGASVRKIVNAIRTAKTTTVRITNYKKDGTPFVNALTLHPVHGLASIPVFTIGATVNAARS